MLRPLRMATCLAMATLLAWASAATPGTKEPDRMLVSFDGVGSIKLGTGAEKLQRMVGGLLIENDKTTHEKDIPTAACVDVQFFTQSGLLGAQIAAGIVVRLDVVDDSTAATKEGIHLGSAEVELKRAYAGRFQEGKFNLLSINSRHGDQGHAFLVRSANDERALLIETDEGGIVRGIHVGPVNAFSIDQDGMIWALPCYF